MILFQTVALVQAYQKEPVNKSAREPPTRQALPEPGTHGAHTAVGQTSQWAAGQWGSGRDADGLGGQVRPAECVTAELRPEMAHT